MAAPVTRNDHKTDSQRMELEESTEKSIRTSFHNHAPSFISSAATNCDATSLSSLEENEDEIELQWAAIERLPTFRRLRLSLFDRKEDGEGEEGKRVVDVTKLEALERHVFVDKLIKKIAEDNCKLLSKFKERIDKVGLELPTVEVRYRNLSVEVEYEVVHGKPLPTLWNTLKTAFGVIANITGCKSVRNKIKILKNVNGIIKPSRMTLLLGPPGCGKTTLLQALAEKLDESLKVEGEISYNGYKLNEFVPQKTSVYISQYDEHISEMTVRETLDFSARCQGIGGREDIMKEISRREKEAGIVPEPDIDTYMKATSVEGLKRTLQTDYILKILGLDICADTMVGDAMRRGISGGQKKRLTTGEMIIGPTKALFMDEISNGLDSSTTFQIVSCMQQFAHITKSTMLVSLLQPAPETFDLFDDIILMAEGKIVYHGPRDNVLEFFEHCGFRCPPRKGIADFLQEVVSERDQGQYWYHKQQPHSYVSIDMLVKNFQEFHVGQKLEGELSRPLQKSESHKNALSFSIYSLRNWELFKACMDREWLLMKRNLSLHVFKSVQLVVTAIITMTVFIRSRMNIDMVDGNLYMGSLFYALIRLMCNGIPELSLTIQRIAVFYKQRDFYFYPAWAYSVPAAILKIPFSLLDAFLWTALTYYVIGFSPEPERFFYHFFLLFLVHQVSVSMFRLIASIVRNPSIASTFALFILLITFLFGGFVIRQPSLPSGLRWGFWLSPVAYAEIGASLNEFLAPRWQKVSSSNITLGQKILESRGLNFNEYFYWIPLGALIGFWIIFNIGFTCALSYLKAPRRSRTIISQERLSTILKRKQDLSDFPSAETPKSAAEMEKIKMVLPFEPITISFQSVQYSVDTPKILRKQGLPQKRLQLLHDITGAFRPGILTALMGVSGAGKTTLMDVLSGRKTGGIIEGEIRIGGYPKAQKTYARISGYCEQTDIHSPQITVEESVMYSAWLRLPAQIDKGTRSEFVAEVIEMIELGEIRDELVGIPGVSGISTEQRKRLTIAVELVSNPSVIFMDEPTSGLDARAAAIVMRVAKNIVNTNRTVVCTIHQPSIDVFEAFDELILMKRGGQIIYSGELGQNSSKLIEYFEGIPGVPKIKENYNPATWMLEVTGSSMEARLGLDFANLYKDSHLFQKNEELVTRLGLPEQGSKELHFSTPFPQNAWEQFKACLWKQELSYWRSPEYNLVRLIFIIASSLIFGALLWQKGQKINDEQDFFNILGSIFIFIQFAGIGNCSSVLPFVATERAIVYRERFAGMYSSWAYSSAQVVVEIPYILLQAVLLLIITYPAINFYWSAYKVLWYFYSMFCTLLYFNYLGLLLVSLTPNFQMASIWASFFYTMTNLFSGYLVPEPKLPRWWAWGYWICPTSWSLKGLLASQYGDIEAEITAYGERKSISSFLRSYFGYKHDDLGLVAVVLLAFPVFFALAFAITTAKLNFQKR
ncbi:PREDICTED: pleiotropic drug resistance protein 3-like [Populus euphratica]|uniref:Pleiotropic drug resistance protein 3-like n=1 Tax=Populus euphratica TaxID=75702 RepID=A0AAJ6X5C7_POPEU|nr:PREDICTED: pleiotropic drug resistance protein 3-like [Populus euphratica]